MGVRVTATGPVFDGRASLAADAFLDRAVMEIAREGVNDVHNVLDSVLRNPTGRYERSIRTERQGNDAVIHDSGIIYGPWLEGVGSRNRTTRFKGYFTFRRVTKQLDGKAVSIAERVLPEYLRRMN